MSRYTIPNLIDIGSTWNVLPEGIHSTTLKEIFNVFAYNKKRQELFLGLERAIEALKYSGCINIYIDGSFVTEKFNPSDIDICWDATGIDIELLDPVFLDFENERANQKLKYGSEFFPMQCFADSTMTYIEFFQIDKLSGQKKGIIHIDTRTMYAVL